MLQQTNKCVSINCAWKISQTNYGYGLDRECGSMCLAFVNNFESATENATSKRAAALIEILRQT